MTANTMHLLRLTFRFQLSFGKTICAPSFLGKRELEHRSARSEKTISRPAFRRRSVEIPVRAHDHTSGWRRSVAAPVEAMQHRIIITKGVDLEDGSRQWCVDTSR